MSLSIAEAFARAHQEGRAAFIPFMTGGFPDRQAFRDIVLALDQAGANIIELGVPFSDPLADGPVIQAASKQALDQGMTPAEVLALAAELSPRLKAALVVMTYYNPVLRLGLASFAEQAAKAGVAGVIIPDLPPEEAGPWSHAAQAQGLDTIFMAAPTTTPERLEIIRGVCRGFLYYVSMTGVTGSGLNVDGELAAGLARVRAGSPLPVAVGFGVAEAAQTRALAPLADGVIVGSALVQAAGNAPEPGQAAAAVGRLAGELAAGLIR
jgi:tryptophan synthase alpha chain